MKFGKTYFWSFLITTLFASSLYAGESNFVPGEALIKFSPNATEIDIKSVLDQWPIEHVKSRFQFAKPLKETPVLEARTNRTIFETGQLFLVSIDAEIDVENACVVISKQLAVEYAHPNRLMKLTALPDDPDISFQQHHYRISSIEAWDIRTSATRVTVAILDSGLLFDHPDIAENVFINSGETGLDSLSRDKRFNGIDDDGNGYIDDWRGWDMADSDNDPLDTHPSPVSHGTHVAGLIGAIGNNGTGGAGVAWNVKLLPLKIVETASPYYLTEASAIEAMMYATSFGAKIINCSWGIDSLPGVALRDAIEATGALAVCAAGNDAHDIVAVPFFPASYDLDTILVVTATNNLDLFASSFASYSALSVDVAAPGTNVYSTVEGGYDSLTGTSMATPIVAGLAALVMAEYPGLAPAEVKQRIMNSVDVFPSLATRCVSSGRVNVYEALYPGNVSTPANTGSIRVVVQLNGTSSAGIYVEVRDNSSGVLIDSADTTVAGITFQGDAFVPGADYTVNVNHIGDTRKMNKSISIASWTLSITESELDVFKLFQLKRKSPSNRPSCGVVPDSPAQSTTLFPFLLLILLILIQRTFRPGLL